MFAIFKNDPLVKSLKGGSTTRRKKSSRRKTLTASEKRVVNATVKRIRSAVRSARPRRRYRNY